MKRWAIVDRPSGTWSNGCTKADEAAGGTRPTPKRPRSPANFLPGDTDLAARKAKLLAGSQQPVGITSITIAPEATRFFRVSD
ncbi:MAG: hypothetical protein HY674_12430 [Chloroflexi bacterium]|nr:hypothetical protein [Chloroflexota bacterium]